MTHNISIRNEYGDTINIKSRPVDKVGVDDRAKSFTTRSIKKQCKLDLLYLAIQMIDLTSLEGSDTVARVKQLVNKAKFPITHDLLNELNNYTEFKKIPQVAAVCVYPTMVSTALEALNGVKINIASVATAFPAGQMDLKLKLLDVQYAISMGATEIDMVINRGAFLSGDYQKTYDEIVSVKKICQNVHLKVILETGELASYDKIRIASDIAMEAGADFIKTSTGKINPAATMPVTLVMLGAIKDHYIRTGKKIGMKPAGGIRTAKQAIHYLCMLNEEMGMEWMTAKLFRFGASSLLNDLLKQIYKQVTGRYAYERAFSID